MAVIAFHLYGYPTVVGLAVLLNASKERLKKLAPVIDLELRTTYRGTETNDTPTF